MIHIMEFTRELKTAKAIAYEAGSVMRMYFRGDQKREIKDDGTPLTIADTTINRLVIERLATAFPDDIVIGEEESTGEYGMGRRWFCDPIDGTKAFTWGVPTAMFSLGLVIDGVPKLGLCYEPITDQLYCAVEGRESFLNDVKISVNDTTLKDGIIAIASAPADIRHNEAVARILDAGHTTAVFSGAVYKASAVADGRFVGYVEHKVNAYDMAAVEVIVREAGGIVTGLDGQPNDYTKPLKGTVVSNKNSHLALMNLIDGAR